MEEVAQAVTTERVKHEHRKWSRWIDAAVKMIVLAGIPAIAADRFSMETRRADDRMAWTSQLNGLQTAVASELAKLRLDLEKMGAARTQIIDDYRINMARMEGQLDQMTNTLMKQGERLARIEARLEGK